VPFGLEEKNGFQPDLDEIARKITPRTTALIFNSPNNPTGTVFKAEALRKIADWHRSTTCGFSRTKLRADFVQRRIRIDLVFAREWRREPLSLMGFRKVLR